MSSLIAPGHRVGGWDISPAKGPLARLLLQKGLARHSSTASLAAPPPYDLLPLPIGRELAKRWPVPCEDAFEWLLAHSPASLIQLVRSNRLPAQDLSIALEFVGRLADTSAVREVVMPRLNHSEAVVREGAIYGLTSHVDAPMRERLADIAANDPSEAVRDAASDLLQE